MSPEWITVALPALKHPRDDVMRTAVMLPIELSDAIGKSVAAAFNVLERPTLDPDPKRGSTSLATH